MTYNVTSDTPLYSCFDGNLSDNSSTPEFWDVPEKYRPASLTTAVFTLIFILVGLPGNTLIIVSILWQRLYRESTHILLLNLAVADLLVCAMVMPLTVVSGFAGNFILGDSDHSKCRWCQTGIIFVALCLFSLHALALLSVDRFVFVKFPLKYHKFVTVQRTVICVVVLWVVCFVISVFPLFGFGDVRFLQTVSTCSLNVYGKNLVYLLILTAESFFPLSVLVITNIWLICIIQKHFRKMYVARKANNDHQLALSISRRLREEKNYKQLQLTRIFGATFLSNFLTWFPLVCWSLAAKVSIQTIGLVSEWIFVFVYLSLTSSAVLHPLIQASLIPEVRTQCKHFLMRAFCGCVWCKGSHSTTTPSAGGRCEASSDSSLESKNIGECLCFDMLSATLLPEE